MKLLFPIIAIIVVVLAALWMFGTNELYNYGVNQSMDTGAQAPIFNIWTQLMTLPSYVWYGAAIICILIGVVQVFKSAT